MDESLTFLKLGGSLITNKDQPGVLREGVITSACEEIRSFREINPGKKLVLGHGSGSFGHVPAARHKTRQGVASQEEWYGFQEVWYQAARLNSILSERLHAQGIPIMAFPVSASAYTQSGSIVHWDLTPLSHALDSGLIPLVYGDVVFDVELGGTILSTEDIFVYLARHFQPSRVLLAGREAGVWSDFSDRTGLIDRATPDEIERYLPTIEAAEGHDVTGGMIEKVKQMAALVREIPGLEVLIFSGLDRNILQDALSGKAVGTFISAQTPGQVQNGSKR
ncbi:MAG: isopentenyl phosphate kinase [Anaerolineales bacterium]|nr:isopentenyl phosphate kinase [Anaerolineales bacterium]